MFSKLKVPMKRGLFYREVELDFVFNIGTIEAACDRLKIEFWQMGEHDSYDFTLAILLEGYLSACKEKYKRPKYGIGHAAYWMEHMSRGEAVKFATCMQDLMGKLKEGVGQKKK
jgi:hypothetical protein